MIAEPLILIAVVIVAYGVVSERLSASVVSAPMVFMLAGIAAGPAGLSLFHASVSGPVLEGFAELTLGLILFADAATTNGVRLAKDNSLPRRLLLIGLPLSIVLGAVIAKLFFAELSWMEAALVAAILAPTDAALGYAVVTSKVVPERIRQAILVESGVNDGLALPAVLLFAALAFSAEGGGGEGAEYWIIFTAQQIGVGAVVGAGLGYGLGRVITAADARGLVAHGFRKLTAVGVAILTLFAAELAGGNGFIAAFVGGLVFGNVCKRRAATLTEFVEEEGQLFSLAIFFLFGAVLLPEATEYFTAMCFLYGLLSLTIIRMGPVALSLVGSGLTRPATAFIGWFGPRGLASILFLFIAVEHEGMGGLPRMEAIVYITVALSVIAHGLTAAPFSRAFGRSVATAETPAKAET
ncbi:MAG: cation:proton antiporter [Pseudomonadota bacterium]